MESAEFLEFGKAMLEYIAEYQENIRDRRVTPTVQPGYLRDLIPAEAPQHGEPWQDIMKDLERVIMPGHTHWQSPHFHAYYPAATSYPSVVAEMLSAGIACLGFSWATSPACTELEVVTMDWLGKAVGLPDQFLSGPSNGKGGGVIQGTASEATFLALLSARERFLKKFKASNDQGQQDTNAENKAKDETAFYEKLVAYTSDQAHSSVEKAGLLGGVKMRLVESDKDLRLRGAQLQAAIQQDKKDGLIPFFVTVTLGTTNSCAFDALDEIGEICKEEGLWLHVDAAYAGAAFICEEYRYLMKGIENADSFNFNPHKWLLVNFDCAALWLKDASEVVEPFKVEPLYLKHGMQGKVPDFRHWQIPFGRRFRSLKLWFVMRIYGVDKLQHLIRSQIQLANEFGQLVSNSSNSSSSVQFEVVTPITMGLVCFRLKGKQNPDNELLLKEINSRGKIHMVPTMLRGQYVLRFAICSRFTTQQDIHFAWNEIQEVAAQIVAKS